MIPQYQFNKKKETQTAHQCGFLGEEGIWDGVQTHSTDELSVPIVVTYRR